MPYFILEQSAFLLETEALLSLSRCEGMVLDSALARGKPMYISLGPLPERLFVMRTECEATTLRGNIMLLELQRKECTKELLSVTAARTH